jgi:hypothetical protein
VIPGTNYFDDLNNAVHSRKLHFTTTMHARERRLLPADILSSRFVTYQSFEAITVCPPGRGGDSPRNCTSSRFRAAFTSGQPANIIAVRSSSVNRRNACPTPFSPPHARGLQPFFFLFLTFIGQTKGLQPFIYLLGLSLN